MHATKPGTYISVVVLNKELMAEKYSKISVKIKEEVV
jgi:hypothetical protein